MADSRKILQAPMCAAGGKHRVSAACSRYLPSYSSIESGPVPAKALLLRHSHVALPATLLPRQAVEAAARQHEACSSKAAVEDRALRGALGMLPRTFMRVKGIFGASGPNALKQQQVGGAAQHWIARLARGRVLR